MVKNIQGYFDWRFYLRFVLLFGLCYAIYTFVFSAASPTGYYSPFVDEYLDFPYLIRYGVLNVGNGLLSLFGYAALVSENRIVSSHGDVFLEMAWPCYGMGLMSFWIAFVYAHALPWKKMLVWSLSGVLLVFMLNCIRVAILMIAMLDRWTIADYLGTNAHDMFNYVCYAALLGLIFLFYAKTKTSGSPSKQKIRSTNTQSTSVVQENYLAN